MSQTPRVDRSYLGTMIRATIASFVLIPAVLILRVAAQSAPPPPAPALSTSPFFRANRNLNEHRTPARHSRFERLAIWSTMAWAADTGTTEIGLATARTSELNPILGSHPSPARLWGTSIALQSIFLYSCHQESQEHPRGRFWRIAMKVSIGVHSAATVNNLLVVALRPH
jgi:hypothetical protein